ncbi:MAG: dehydrogenase [Acidobacteria bacterium]|nr:dehydrogenase [Acidobacteriota bacterium]
MFRELLERWPVVKQIRSGDLRATGETAWSPQTHELRPKIHDCEQTRSICPYCGVGCGQVIYHKDNRIVQIEGDPDSPISRGHLCPKGADTKELHTHAHRLSQVKYRRPFATKWEPLDLETAMDMIAHRVWQTRKHSFTEQQEGEPVMHTQAMAHLGGATLDNEENYLIKKLFTGGLGMVCVSNQARI